MVPLAIRAAKVRQAHFSTLKGVSMNKWLQILIAGIAAGLTQYGILVAAGVTEMQPLLAGVLGTIGTTIAGLLKQLPQRPWSEEERMTKLGDKS